MTNYEPGTLRPGDVTIDVRKGMASTVLLILLLFSPPLFVLERYSLTAINKPLILGLIALLALLYAHRLTIQRSVAELTFLQLLQAALLLTLPFLHQTFGYALDRGYFSLAIQVLASAALLLVFANARRSRQLADFWVNLHLVMGVFAVLVFVGGVAINLEPISTFSDRPYYDFGLAYTNIYYQIGGLKLIRVAGFYDEPGTFAFYMTFALLLCRLYNLPRWKEALLVVCGMTTISMAFFVVVALWGLFTLNRRSIKYLVLFAALLTLALGRASPEVRDYAYSVTLDRFNVSTAGDRLLKGDSRTPIMRDNYRAFTDSPVLGHGLHYEDYVGARYTWSFIVNPAAPFATHGALGALIVNLHVIVLIILLIRTRRLSRYDKAFVLLTLIATLAQRPVTINGFGYLLFILMIHRLTAEKTMALAAAPTGASDGRTDSESRRRPTVPAS